MAGFPTTLYLVRLLTANAFYMLDYGQNSGGMGRILAQVDQDPPNLYVGKPQIRNRPGRNLSIPGLSPIRIDYVKCNLGKKFILKRS